ncbi:hypothetical protein [Microvirga aerophila]|uniref:hypothetical protein n=1 Tax=Microvirga aerophila TaxID=670291 RepID=UPI0011BE9DA4|nr:hypothetical protein [Microvirga aerophila]
MPAFLLLIASQGILHTLIRGTLLSLNFPWNKCRTLGDVPAGTGERKTDPDLAQPPIREREVEKQSWLAA